MSVKALHIRIVTPDAVIYESDSISYATIPTGKGEITILPDHIPLITNIKRGEIRIEKDGEILGLAVSAGILEIRHNSDVVILAERSELAHTIDIERAEVAYARAAQLRERSKDDEDIDSARIEALMEKELNRINIGKKWRR